MAAKYLLSKDKSHSPAIKIDFGDSKISIGKEKEQKNSRNGRQNGYTSNNKSEQIQKHHIRQRAIDKNKKLPIIYTTHETLTLDSANIPQPPPVPITSLVVPITPPVYPKRFNPQGHYYRKQITHIGRRYDASQTDYTFYKQLLKDYSLNKEVFTLESFETIIQIWEHETNRGAIIPFERAQMLVESKNLVIIARYLRKIYSYWKQRREQLKHPLLRWYYKSDYATDESLKAIFLDTRDPKMNLRTNARSSEEIFKGLEQLKSRLEKATVIVAAMFYEEQAKQVALKADAMRYDSLTRRNDMVWFRQPLNEQDIFKRILDFKNLHNFHPATLTVDDGPLPSSIIKLTNPWSKKKSTKWNKFDFSVAEALWNLANFWDDEEAWPLIENRTQKKRKIQQDTEDISEQISDLEAGKKDQVSTFRARRRRMGGWAVERQPKPVDFVLPWCTIVNQYGKRIKPYQEQTANEDFYDCDAEVFRKFRRHLQQQFRAFQRRNNSKS